MRTLIRLLPSPIKSFIKALTFYRIISRYRFAMSYYKRQLAILRRWIWRDTEDSNFYYKLDELNREHLLQLVATVTGCTISEIEGYFSELEADNELRAHIERELKTSGYGRDIKVDFGRRLGWYTFVRVLKPKVVVETGVEHGVGSCVLASALLRNAAEGAPGKYYGTDINPKAGKLFAGKYASMGKILYGDSIESLQNFNEQIDLFINDSDHSAEYEYQEYEVVKDKLSPNALILGDNSHVTDCLSRFSRRHARKFVFFQEKPKDHWYPGAGIGISYR